MRRVQFENGIHSEIVQVNQLIMAFSLLKVKNILNQKRGRLAGSGSLEPEVGVSVSARVGLPGPLVRVTLIGARHLPSLFGLTGAKGYVVKVISSYVVFDRLLFITYSQTCLRVRLYIFILLSSIQLVYNGKFSQR